MIDRRLYNATVRVQRGGAVRYDGLSARVDPPSDEQIGIDGGQVNYAIILPVAAADGTPVRIAQNDLLFITDCPSVPQLVGAGGALLLSDVRPAPGAIPGIYARAAWKVQP